MRDDLSPDSVQTFITRWKQSGAAERANYQLFLSELCDVLGVERPRPARGDEAGGEYVFERPVTFHNPDGTTSPGRIDLYKRGSFVLEAKQGSERPDVDEGGARPARRGVALRGTRGWDLKMREALGQAERYVRALPPAEGNPPFILVVDVGHSVELYSDFSRAGKTYVPYPDPRAHRLYLEDLARAEVRALLRRVWDEPLALDPARQSARVTREMAERLASLARSLEAAGHRPERVAHFLMRAIFTMFAEDMRLLPARGWTELLESLRAAPHKFAPLVSALWAEMNHGGFSPTLREELPQFNGGLFESVEALALDASQLELLTEASRLDWRDVEPAIFGTLLERALDPRERHRLGAHYTPRAYVERLVMPAVIEPLREEWADTLAAAATLHAQGRDAEAAREVKEFHRRLCRVRVLDPACGSGNFLYVTLEHLKRLEGEVLDALHGFGERQGVLEDAGLTVDPGQLLGLEVNPRAAAIADLVLWIGYLQWHFRTRGEARPPEPVLKKFHNVETRDAVLAYDRIEPVTDDAGQPVTRWDGRTFKKHPVTGEDVPDESARLQLQRYLNPRPADWPPADFIVGNPPFVGAKRIRLSLGDEYVEALRNAYKEVPDTCDYVMYWWHKAAELAGKEQVRRFGFITTNSIVQSYSRGLIEKHLNNPKGVSIVLAIPDHPWIESKGGADVRVAMTVAMPRRLYAGKATLLTVEDESSQGKTPSVNAHNVPSINAKLRGDFDAPQLQPLKANKNICFSGIMPGGQGFKLDLEDVTRMGLDINALPQTVKQYIIGRDIVQRPRNSFIVDFYGMTESEARSKWPNLYQWVLDRVKPEREHNRREIRRKNWWLFSENAPNLRQAIKGLCRFIVTPNTAKHRVFIFIDGSVLPDITTYAVASDDAYYLGLLSSQAHTLWSLAAGGRMGVGNDPRYNSKSSFEPFPFPDCSEAQRARVRELGEQLDAHRKRRQAAHPALTITEMYNVLARLRAGETLSERERATHEQGLVSVLAALHDELDAAVADAYGFPADLADEDLLARLVRLNAERAAEERGGRVRWLRPDFQRPATGVAARFDDALDAGAAPRAPARKQPWPRTLPEQARALRQLLATERGLTTPTALARRFTRARVERVAELLQTLVSLGHAREVAPGQYAA